LLTYTSKRGTRRHLRGSRTVKLLPPSLPPQTDIMR